MVETEMTEIMKSLDSVTITLPDIGYINDGIILDKIDDIQRFSTPSALLAFDSLDSSLYQAENFQIRRTFKPKLPFPQIHTKQRSSQCSKNNASFKAYYDKKISEDPSHCNVLGHYAANFSQSSGKCRLTKWNLTSINGSVYQYR